MNIANQPFRRPRFAGAVLAFIGLSAPTGGSELADADVGDPYPLINCVVTEEPLEEDALVFTYEGRELRTCCFDCEDDLKKDHDTWIRTIDDRIVQQQQAYYPLTTCVVNGEPLEKTGSINVVFRNRLFLLSSFECQEELEKHPAVYFARLNKAVIKKQKPAYPLATCIVSGKPLGDAAVDHVAGNQLVRLFSSEQLQAFDANPGKYLSELRKLGRGKLAAQAK